VRKFRLTITETDTEIFYMKNPIGKTAAAPVMYNGYHHIVDDGDCDSHGYFLQKQNAGKLKPVCNSGVNYVDVPRGVLRKALIALSANQKKRLVAAGLA